MLCVCTCTGSLYLLCFYTNKKVPSAIAGVPMNARRVTQSATTRPLGQSRRARDLHPRLRGYVLYGRRATLSLAAIVLAHSSADRPLLTVSQMPSADPSPRTSPRKRARILAHEAYSEGLQTDVEGTPTQATPRSRRKLEDDQVATLMTLFNYDTQPTTARKQVIAQELGVCVLLHSVQLL